MDSNSVPPDLGAPGLDSVGSIAGWVTDADAGSLAGALKTWLAGLAAQNPDHTAIKPGHRVKFQWPPHPVSYQYHVQPGDWQERTTLNMHGEEFEIQVARTQHGVFGRCEDIWLETKAESLDSMLREMQDQAEPYFARKIAINKVLGRPGRFMGAFKDLPPLQILKILYAEDRDIANEARLQLEQRAGNGLYTQAMIAILEDETHPYRRSAQWCVLDLFEDLGTYCRSEAEEQQAVDAMRKLIWNAPDDFARTTFKAGVVLGGHLPDVWGGQVLVDCLDAPSKYGRRSAIHGLFHVVEWVPDLGSSVIAHLKAHAGRESEPALADFSLKIANDLAARKLDHFPEPIFPEEAA